MGPERRAQRQALGLLQHELTEGAEQKLGRRTPRMRYRSTTQAAYSALVVRETGCQTLEGFFDWIVRSNHSTAEGPRALPFMHPFLQGPERIETEETHPNAA